MVLLDEPIVRLNPFGISAVILAIPLLGIGFPVVKITFTLPLADVNPYGSTTPPVVVN